MLLPFVADVNHFIKDTIVADGLATCCNNGRCCCHMADVIAIDNW